MAAADPLNALEVPGRLIVELAGQTLDKTLAYPFGGTDMGLVKDVVWQRIATLEQVPAEGDGGAAPPIGIVDTQYLGEAWLIVFALRGADDDAAGVIWPNTSVGVIAKRVGILGEGTILPGQLLSTIAVPVLFVPDDVQNHQAVFLPLAIPEVAEDLEVQLAHSKERLLIAKFRAIPEATKVPQIQLLEDMTL